MKMIFFAMPPLRLIQTLQHLDHVCCYDIPSRPLPCNCHLLSRDPIAIDENLPLVRRLRNYKDRSCWQLLFHFIIWEPGIPKLDSQMAVDLTAKYVQTHKCVNFSTMVLCLAQLMARTGIKRLLKLLIFRVS